jgi:hypothetical protein
VCCFADITVEEELALSITLLIGWLFAADPLLLAACAGAADAAAGK